MPEQRYISQELSHFVGKGRAAEEQYALLLEILRTGWLTHPPHDPSISGNLEGDWTADFSTNEMFLPQMVCFCDIPVEDLALHAAKYSPFGLSFLRDYVVDKGASPIFYVPRHSKVKVPRSNLSLTGNDIKRLIEESGAEGFTRLVDKDNHVNHLMDYYAQLVNLAMNDESRMIMELIRFLEFHVFAYMKFYNHDLADDDPENYYFEREWRVVGNVRFDLEAVHRVFMTREYAERFRENLPEYTRQLTFI